MDILSSTDNTDPILRSDNSRFILHPIRYPEIWSAYKTAQAAFWTAEELNMTIDRGHWEIRLTEDERQFISTVLAFFAASDGIVNENLVQRFCAEVQIPEARCFYGFQIMMENIHAEAYAIMLLALVRDLAARTRLFSAIDTITSIKRKAAWTMQWTEDANQPFSVRLVAFAAVEGIFFSSSFAAIFWLRSRGLMPGLCHANELIARDEGMHTNFAVLLHNHLQDGVDETTAHTIVSQAVDLEQAFFDEALPVRLDGMNTSLMSDYIQHVADRLLLTLGFRPKYKKANPFPFVTSMALDGRTNFFERRVSDYRLAMHNTRRPLVSAQSSNASPCDLYVSLSES
ncbi:putative ribonucleoside-diphosphate reductase small chain B [Polyporus arcularius HHB13444]|uniref:Putative ribonucleoside-diphosphate reductase small chain B n=1 Tax=Polyporus arcularius HHB13444 TaxID=1314778 RepID=A0A5C3PG54_9APHY|nr:putative ribonucleoside-diphosphate reductase small chain B [Polyporus arcularius HHB13444]